MTPDIIEGSNNPDLTMDDIKGNCNIQKAYYFFDGQWVLYSMPEMDSTLLGKGLAIKVSENCNFGRNEETTTPPPELP